MAKAKTGLDYEEDASVYVQIHALVSCITQLKAEIDLLRSDLATIVQLNNLTADTDQAFEELKQEGGI